MCNSVRRSPLGGNGAGWRIAAARQTLRGAVRRPVLDGRVRGSGRTSRPALMPRRLRLNSLRADMRPCRPLPWNSITSHTWGSRPGCQMRVVTPGDAGQLAGLRQMRPAIARMVAALRAGVGVAAVTSGLLTGGAPLSWWILAPALGVVPGGAACSVSVAWPRGLRDWLVGTALLLAGLWCLAIGHLVPSSALAGSTSWVGLTAAMAVVSAQLAGKPVLWLPPCLVVAGTMFIGARLAPRPDGGEDAGGRLGTPAWLTPVVVVLRLC